MIIKINFKDINKIYNKKKILINTSLKIKGKRITSLIGANGSGKTTLIKILLNIVKPTKNNTKIIINNKNHVNKIDRLKNIIGYMTQNPKFPNNLKVKEIIEIFENIKNIKPIYKEKIINELYINKYFNKKINELSHGMIQKINILQAFMFNNLIFILDEPTAGIDDKTSKYLKDLIIERKKNGCSILFTSHIIMDIKELANNIIMISEGIIKYNKKN